MFSKKKFQSVIYEFACWVVSHTSLRIKQSSGFGLSLSCFEFLRFATIRVGNSLSFLSFFFLTIWFQKKNSTIKLFKKNNKISSDFSQFEFLSFEITYFFSLSPISYFSCVANGVLTQYEFLCKVTSWVFAKFVVLSCVTIIVFFHN